MIWISIKGTFKLSGIKKGNTLINGNMLENQKIQV